MSNLNLKGLWIPIEILTDKNLSDKEKHIYSLVIFLSQEKQYCFCTNKTISELLNISVTQVSKLVNSLKDKGYINIEMVYKENSKEVDIRKLIPNVSNIANKTYVTWAEKDGTYEINDTQTTKPSDWYDYENGKWANIKTVKDGLEAYWVWIPRFEYVVPTSTTAIDVKFISKSKTTADSGYTIHPAFTWKKTENGTTTTKELDGIWVAKFEASSNTETPDTNYGGGDTTSLQVQIKPGTQSWRNISPKNMFTVCRDIQKTGVLAGSTNVDSHMMKNIEWGAVAILSQSKYGVYNPKSSTGLISNGGDGTLRVWNNPNGYNSGKYIYTGYAGNNADASTNWTDSSEPTNMYFYNTINGTKASTTGTVYGIYDMSGCSSEYVAGCLRGQENSKFGVTTGDIEYIDLYTNGNDSSSDCSGAIVGDVTKETKIHTLCIQVILCFYEEEIVVTALM